VLFDERRCPCHVTRSNAVLNRQVEESLRDEPGTGTSMQGSNRLGR
jgi:hypothetical protein